jgi:hypothetical protein
MTCSSETLLFTYLKGDIGLQSDSSAILLIEWYSTAAGLCGRASCRTCRNTRWMKCERLMIRLSSRTERMAMVEEEAVATSLDIHRLHRRSLDTAQSSVQSDARDVRSRSTAATAPNRLRSGMPASTSAQVNRN